MAIYRGKSYDNYYIYLDFNFKNKFKIFNNSIKTIVIITKMNGVPEYIN